MRNYPEYKALKDVSWKEKKDIELLTTYSDELWKRFVYTSGVCLISDKGNIIVNGKVEYPTLIDGEWMIRVDVSKNKRWVRVEELVISAFSDKEK